jgi:hypothetical protein
MSKCGEDCGAPENRRPRPDRAGKKTRHEDGEEEAYGGTKKECGSASQPEHVGQAIRV